MIKNYAAELTWGIEVECFGKSAENILYDIKTVLGGRIFNNSLIAGNNKEWKVVEDTSIIPDNDCTCECSCLDLCYCDSGDDCTCECYCWELCYCHDLECRCHELPEGEFCPVCAGDEECPYCNSTKECGYCSGDDVCECECAYCRGNEQCDYCFGEHECECNPAWELVSPPLTVDEIPQALEAIDTLRYSASVNNSCGVHIHVGGTFLPKHIVNLIKTTYKYQQIIYNILEVEEDREYRYAKKILPQLVIEINQEKPQTWDDLNKLWYNSSTPTIPSRYNYSRYRGLNINSVFYRNTVEFRWFNGTLDIKKIEAYILFCLGLVARATRVSRTNSTPINLENKLQTWRAFLNTLGFTGNEHEDSRQILTRGL